MNSRQARTRRRGGSQQAGASKRPLHPRSSEGISNAFENQNDILTESDDSIERHSSVSSEENEDNMEIDNEESRKMNDSRVSVRLDDVLSKDPEHYDTDMEDHTALLPTKLKPTFDSSPTEAPRRSGTDHEESKRSEYHHRVSSIHRSHRRHRGETSRPVSKRSNLRADRHRRNDREVSDPEELKDEQNSEQSSLSKRSDRRTYNSRRRRNRASNMNDEDSKRDSEDVSMTAHDSDDETEEEEDRSIRVRKSKPKKKKDRAVRSSVPAAPRKHDRLNSPPKQLRIRWRRLMNVSLNGEWGFVEEIDKRRGRVLFVQRYKDSETNQWRRFEKWVKMNSKRLEIPDRRKPRPVTK